MIHSANELPNYHDFANMLCALLERIGFFSLSNKYRYISDLSKVEAGKLELKLCQVNLRGLLENSLVMIKEKALKHGIKLLHHLDGVPETIIADERKLKQIMYNLLSNADDFKCRCICWNQRK